MENRSPYRSPRPAPRTARARGKTRQKAGRPRALAQALKLLGAALAALLFLGGFAVERSGGWQQLYTAFGLEAAVPAAAAAGESSVTFFDVGQGDAVLLAQGGEYALIDAGTNAAAADLLQDLADAGVERLKLVVMTHPHADHIGGMDEVLTAIPTDAVLLPDLETLGYSSATLDRVLNVIAERTIPAYTATAGAAYPVGQGELTVLSAGYTPPGGSADDNVNDSSLCLRYTCGNFSFLDTGDAEKAAEKALVESGADCRAQLFKAGHHGSSTSNSQLLLQAVQPQVAVISCGLNNDYGHPHASVLERFAAAGIETFRTDLQGSVTVTFGADGLRVSTTKTDTDALLPAA